MKFAALIEYIFDKEKIGTIRPAHRAYLTKLLGEGKLAISGPFTDDYGAMIVYEAATAEEALTFLQGDPFHAGGVDWLQTGVFSGALSREWGRGVFGVECVEFFFVGRNRQ